MSSIKKQLIGSDGKKVKVHKNLKSALMASTENLKQYHKAYLVLDAEKRARGRGKR